MFILAELDKSENISTFKKVMHLNRGGPPPPYIARMVGY